MAQHNQKTTFVLPTPMVHRIREAVDSGLAPSSSYLVREAVSRYLEVLENERRHREMQEAARDPLFMADLKETMQAFASADAEATRLLDN